MSVSSEVTTDKVQAVSRLKEQEDTSQQPSKEAKTLEDLQHATPNPGDGEWCVMY